MGETPKLSFPRKWESREMLDPRIRGDDSFVTCPQKTDQLQPKKQPMKDGEFYGGIFSTTILATN